MTLVYRGSLAVQWRQFMEGRPRMSTEDVSPRYLDLDLWPVAEQVKGIWATQVDAIAALEPALPALAAAVEAAGTRLRQGGRLVYCGAGTSARIGVQDGAELAPTFNWPADKVAFVIAGGPEALLRAVENAEDSAEDGSAQIARLNVGPDDVVLGIAASGNTPFTVAAIKTARTRGAMTVGIANNHGSQLLEAAEYPVLVETGAEIIAGSTRLKAGTAQKVALNIFSTAVMVRLGRVYRGLMVDMRPTNAKLRQRAVEMVARLTDCDQATAADALLKAGGEMKLAVLVLNGLAVEEAVSLLAQSDGNLRTALDKVRGR
jgi:N-acetylmuramic acid 6-phosphate etherase